MTRVTNEAWAKAGWHSTWTRPPTDVYGGTAVDIYVDVTPSEAQAKTDFGNYQAEANNRGFTNAVDGSGLGDQSTTYQHVVSDNTTYEVIWRDRNCVGIVYLGTGIPPHPDVSLPTALTFAVQQESPIDANLSDYQ